MVSIVALSALAVTPDRISETWVGRSCGLQRIYVKDNHIAKECVDELRYVICDSQIMSKQVLANEKESNYTHWLQWIALSPVRS